MFKYKVYKPEIFCSKFTKYIMFWKIWESNMFIVTYLISVINIT